MVNEGWEHLVEVDSREFRVRAMGVRLTVLLGLTRELAEYNTAARWLGSVSCEEEKARSRAREFDGRRQADAHGAFQANAKLMFSTAGKVSSKGIPPSAAPPF